MRFEAYPDAGGQWRWRLVANNGRIVADGAEGYATKGNYDDAKAGAWAVLAERMHVRDARQAWRLVSTQQEPTWVWSWQREGVAS